MDANIDPSVTGADRALLKQHMLNAKPQHRENVIMLYHGRILSNHPALLKTVRTLPPQTLPGDKPGGPHVMTGLPWQARTVALSDASPVAADAGFGVPQLIAQGVGCVNSPTSSGLTGPFRIAYSICGYSHYTGYVELPDCNTKMNNLPQGSTAQDIGYAYVGAFNANGDNVDAGLQYSAQNNWWSPYYKSSGAPVTDSPPYKCGTNVYIEFYITPTDIVLHEEGTIVPGSEPLFPNATTNSYTLYDSYDSTSAWNPDGTGEFIKRMTTIGQKPENLFSQEYFGVDASTLGAVFPNIPTPLIGWYNQQVGTSNTAATMAFDQTDGSLDEYPGDDSKVIWQRYSNGGPLDELEGFYLHS